MLGIGLIGALASSPVLAFNGITWVETEQEAKDNDASDEDFQGIMYANQLDFLGDDFDDDEYPVSDEWDETDDRLSGENTTMSPDGSPWCNTAKETLEYEPLFDGEVDDVDANTFSTEVTGQEKWWTLATSERDMAPVIHSSVQYTNDDDDEYVPLWDERIDDFPMSGEEKFDRDMELVKRFCTEPEYARQRIRDLQTAIEDGANALGKKLTEYGASFVDKASDAYDSACLYVHGLPHKIFELEEAIKQGASYGASEISRGSKAIGNAISDNIGETFSIISDAGKSAYNTLTTAGESFKETLQAREYGRLMHDSMFPHEVNGVDALISTSKSLAHKAYDKASELVEEIDRRTHYDICADDTNFIFITQNVARCVPKVSFNISPSIS
jgi:hypothetical protein